MPYPLMLAPSGQEIMRINYDATTSVRWDRVVHHRYEPITPRNLVLVRLCEVLLAARDNFVVTPWDVSDGWHDKWNHFVCQIDYLVLVPPEAKMFFTVANNEGVIARINRDGTWAIQWPKIEDASRMVIDTSWEVPLIGFARLLIAARDRFRTVPWTEPREADDC